ncbi:hypothetical protein V8G54_032378 [Vigna mungo]|uniref:Alpha-ketoglutarate-dependent dioxygenase AlkB-like domain-containing protein n=1 Tax=Vigna mungo TaxID=3915 RepID=A0AAQ3MLW4_VIGMU
MDIIHMLILPNGCLCNRLSVLVGKLDETFSPEEGFESSGDHVVEMPFNGNVSNSESLSKRNEKQWDSPRNCSQRRDSATSVKEDEKSVFGSSPENLVGCKQSDFEILLNDGICEGSSFKNGLSDERKERIRYSLVCRKDFTFVERINRRNINVLQGLELHTEVFNELEQRKIVEWIYRLQWRGQQGKLKATELIKERQNSLAVFWVRTTWFFQNLVGNILQIEHIQNQESGCVDKSGKPPGIMRDEEVDPLPPVFKQMIKRMVRWNIVHSSCIPDSCIVNIYEEGDCIPPHIDHHDFVRPFYTVSFLSECKILFGSNLQVVSAGEFAGPISISLPVGSVFVLNGNGADIAKHCIPSVSSKSKLPYKFSPDPDLVGIKPLVFSSLNKSDKAQDEVRNLNIQQQHKAAESVESESNIA